MTSPSTDPSSSSLVGGTSILFAPNPPTLPNQATSVDGRLELEAAYAPPSPLETVSLFRRRYPLRLYRLPLPFTTPTRYASSSGLLIVAPHPRRPHSNLVDLLEGSLRRFSLSDTYDRLDIHDAPSVMPHAHSPTISTRTSSTSTDSPGSNSNSGVSLSPQDLNDLSTLIIDIDVVDIEEGGSLNCPTAEPLVEAYLDRADALEINWRASVLDGDGEKGYSFLRHLFKCLNGIPRSPAQQESHLPPTLLLTVQGEETTESADPVGHIDALRRISISVPADVVIELATFASANRSSPDLLNASRLQEFVWKGAFGLLAGNLRRIPLNQLTLLEVESSLTISDALVLLRECQNLVKGKLGVLQLSSSLVNLLEVDLPELRRLHLVTNADLRPFLLRLEAKRLDTLELEFHTGGQPHVTTAVYLSSAYDLRSFKVKAELNHSLATTLKELNPLVSLA